MKLRRRRGIGTVIATAIMIFLMVFTIGQLYVYSIEELDNYNRVASQSFATESQKLSEHISIQTVTLDTSGTVSPDILANITVSNTGGETSQVVDVWFDDADASTALHNVVQLRNEFISRGASATLANLDTGIAYAVLHKIRVSVITALGNTVSTLMLPPGLAGTTAQTSATTSLTIVPPNPITSNDLTVLFSVTNTNGLGGAFTNLAPDICINQGTSANPLGTCHLKTSSYPLCDPGGGTSSRPVGCTFFPGEYGVPMSGCTSTTQCTVTVTPTRSTNTYTPQIFPSWAAGTVTVSSETTSGFTVTFQNAAPLGATFGWSLGPAASPASLAFLPYGATAFFQWTFEVNTLIPDSPITIQASYQNLTTPGLLPSQIQTQTATVRGPGGASGNSGGNFQEALGSFVIYFSSFLYSQDTSNPQTWSSGFSFAHSARTVFQIQVGNIGQNPVTLNANTVLSMISLSGSGGGTAFFIIPSSPCTSPSSWFGSTSAKVCAYSSDIVIQPGQTATLYFGASTPGTTSSNSSPAAGSYAVIFGMVGTISGSSYGQSIPFTVVLVT